MRRMTTFIFGVIVGALLLYAALNYHLIRAQDGMHLIPKVEATLAATYVDVRSFGPGDWVRHADVAMALVNADRSDLLQSAAADSLSTGIDRLLKDPPP